MDGKVDSPTWIRVTIIVAVIGAVALIAVPIVNRLLDIYVPISTPTVSQGITGQQTIALSDKFDESAGSYDTNLWTCASECNVENLFLKDGVLNLQRKNEGVTNIISRSKWAYGDLASLTGKFLISSNLNQGEIGWLSFTDNVAGCGFWGTGDPYVQCSIGPYVNEKHEYTTDNIPVKSDAWHSIKYKFDQNSNSIKFYLDNALIGDYILTNFPATLQIDSGIYSPGTTSSGHIYIDDVILTLNK